MNPQRASGGVPWKRSAGMLLPFALIVLLLGTAVPVRAQELRLEGLGGERLTEADLHQGPWIVVVWASWSPRSRGIAERVNALARRFGGKARVVAVNFQENRGAVDGFLAGGRFDVPVYLDPDGALAKRYAIANLPGLLVLKGGEAAYRGKLNEDADRELTELLP
jgi:thiol-disulfide isomerase/thioredoxin